MAQNIFSVDGKYYDVIVTSLKRNFTVQDTDKAGRALDGNMIRDIIGTYYNYTMELGTSMLSNSEYDELYQVLSAPADSHLLVLPYGQTTLEFKAYISKGDDELIRVYPDGSKKWNKLTCTFTAMSPERR